MNGSRMHRVSVMVEVLAENPNEAVIYVDKNLITDTVIKDNRFLGFSVTTPGEPTREVMP